MFLTKNPSNLPAQSRFSDLRNKAEMDIEQWRPQPNEILLGVFIDWRSVSTHYGENFQVIIQTDSGAYFSAWMTPYIKQSLLNQKAEKGDLLSIKFLGKRISKGGTNYNAYEVIVDKG